VNERFDHLNRLDPLTRDALAWIVRLKSGEATLADAEQLIVWRAQSPAHERAFRDAVKCWRAIGRGLVSDRSVRRRGRHKTKGTALS
jgi:ferric-dicitrate binding protein FerR (iron transport regulator)